MPKVTSTTKPLKPYRRGETLGKASRAGKLPRAAPKAVGEKSASTEMEAEDEEEEEVGGELGEGGEVEVKEKRKSGKKGKKFVESQDALLSLVASIAGEKDAKKKEKLSKTKPPPKISEAQHKINNALLKREQLDAAKAVITAQTRAKKDRRKDREAKASAASLPPTADAPPETRKRVSFA